MQAREPGFFNSVFQPELSAHDRKKGDDSRRISRIYFTGIYIKQSAKFGNSNYRWESWMTGKQIVFKVLSFFPPL